MKIAAVRAAPLRLPGSPVPVPVPHQPRMPSDFVLQELRGACLEELDQVGLEAGIGLAPCCVPLPTTVKLARVAGARLVLCTQGGPTCAAMMQACQLTSCLLPPLRNHSSHIVNCVTSQVESDLDAEQKEDDDLRWVGRQGRQGRGSVAAHCSCAATAAAQRCAGSELPVIKQAAAGMTLLTNTGMSPGT